MAFRRQELTRRRKAVGFTQESLAEHLGVERSTVIRWEAGDSEPLPSIRPNLARALQLSIDQLAELLTTSEDAGTTRTSADPEMTTPVVPPEAQPGGPELANLIHPQVAETVEALRRALRSAGVSAEDLAAMLCLGGSSRAPLGAPEPMTTIPPDIKPTDVQRRRASSRRCGRFTAVSFFVLAFPAIWLSAPFVISHSDVGPQAGAATPVVAIPVPNPGNDNSPRSGAVDTAPVVTPAGDPAPPVAVAVPASHPTRATGNRRTVSRSIPRIVTPEWKLPAAVARHHWNVPWSLSPARW
jgi:transcriptional regulator with XRE-family HTH domain